MDANLLRAASLAPATARLARSARAHPSRRQANGTRARSDPAARRRILPPPSRPDATVLLERYRAAAVTLSREVVAASYGLPVEALSAPTRSVADVAFARQVAMYLAHTVFGVSQAQVAARFGRDRTTVRHACALVEDARDGADTRERLARLEAQLSITRDALHAFAHALDDRRLDAELCLPRAPDGPAGDVGGAA